MSVDRQTQALLDLVEADRRQKCHAILSEAQGRASAVLEQAHADARARMRNAFQEERAAQWARIDAASFLSVEEKRRMAGLG